MTPRPIDLHPQCHYNGFMDYRDFLKETLERKQKINPRFSLRALAQQLGLGPAKLSEILNYKKGLSAASALQVAVKLGLQGEQKELFLLSVQKNHSRSPRQRAQAEQKWTELMNTVQISEPLQTEALRAWYIPAIKACIELYPDRINDMTKALDLTDHEVDVALRSLRVLKKYHAKKSIIAIDPTSLMPKLNELYSSLPAMELANAHFLWLDQEQKKKLKLEMLTLLEKYKLKKKNQKLFCIPEFILPIY